MASELEERIGKARVQEQSLISTEIRIHRLFAAAIVLTAPWRLQCAEHAVISRCKLLGRRRKKKKKLTRINVVHRETANNWRCPALSEGWLFLSKIALTNICVHDANDLLRTVGHPAVLLYIYTFQSETL